MFLFLILILIKVTNTGMYIETVPLIYIYMDGNSRSIAREELIYKISINIHQQQTN